MSQRASRLVLVVEDSGHCAETLQIAFEALPDVEVRVCASARTMWPILETDGARLAAVVTDLHLTEFDGFEIIRTLRQDGRFSKIPILLISGDSDPRISQIALSHGASAYFPKPYSPAAVRKKLEELLC
ncbi:MAG TPA: response regulator [Bryobacteraceae bacterium]|jgi:two-component system chemotaxis response regulator CheY|nr:response regulator [Bryobacteraceae bacterium]